MVTLDGSFGEGGGQIVRSALSLSLATQQPFRITHLRAGRDKPGLQRQHLTAVRAAAEVGAAQVDGAALHSRELIFRPGPVRPGDYTFSIGSAGSTMLVLQTVLPVLLTADRPSSLTLEGGTHNHKAPPFEFIARSFLPLINRLGPRVEITLERPGFYPAGGGSLHVTVQPALHWQPLELTSHGPRRRIRAAGVVAKLPPHIAERELNTIATGLDLPADALTVVEETRSVSPGNYCLIEVESEQVIEVFSGIGRRGVRAEEIAQAALDEALPYVLSNVPVGPHLADQLLLPLALGCGGSYVTGPLTDHTLTNIEVIRRFLDVPISVEPLDDERILIRVGSRLKNVP